MPKFLYITYFRAMRRHACFAFIMLSVAATGGGCLKREVAGIYYGKIDVPQIQELRWSDGGLPRTFDPARAATAPETDAVRALYEGLTEYDARTLEVVPGVAMRWQTSDDNRQWTFYLRSDARWSNGESVTANDFVASWRRAAMMGEFAPHRRLMQNIEGVRPLVSVSREAPNEVVNLASDDADNDVASGNNSSSHNKASSAVGSNDDTSGTSVTSSDASPIDEQAFGVEAVDKRTLRVRLKRPDADFPSLVAHTMFRPIYARDAQTASSSSEAARRRDDKAQITSPSVPTNGAFRFGSQSIDRVVLERAGTYWDVRAVKLDRVQFVETKDAEETLSRYRAGEIDLVTNVALEPLAVKLLTSYQDFQRETFGALNFYRFNSSRPPFDDARVRRAFALAINRDKLNRDTHGDTIVPARTFMPSDATTGAVNLDSEMCLTHDVSKARELMIDAGYEGVGNFPVVRLLINRNDEQRAVALSVAEMWRTALGIETEIIIKDWSDYEAAVRAGDFDIARRSHVMQTPDESNNMRLMFEMETVNDPSADASRNNVSPDTQSSVNQALSLNGAMPSPPEANSSPDIATDRKALELLPAVPLYFAASFSLAKPYVTNFNRNMLDATSLKHIEIDTAWRPPDEASKIIIKYGE
ncbi:MAG: peptide ABC transporter substrate-binding protein [Pyrinomonadaceae bacterium MAG19_C2-C3]|nr:peptide ABC transporter substrate-binding protein [Pyrinomonadaceae bacterium MAG19_C2-C3]